MLASDKEAAEKLILPDQWQQIADVRLFSAYLTESLLSEILRVKRGVGLGDMRNSFNKLNYSLTQTMQATAQ